MWLDSGFPRIEHFLDKCATFCKTSKEIGMFGLKSSKEIKVSTGHFEAM